MNPAQINARVVMSSQMFGIVEIHVGAGLGQVWGRFETCPYQCQYARRRGGGDSHRSAMNPAQINAGVVMSSQMFGIVEIHVGAGLGQV